MNSTGSVGNEYVNPALGLTLATIASLVSALGLIMMKLAHVALEKINHGDIQRICMPTYFHPYWILGFIGLLVAQILNTYALEYASVILLSSTACFTIIFNSILAPLMLNESFHARSELPTLLLLVVGCTLCIVQEPEVFFTADNEIRQIVNF